MSYKQKIIARPRAWLVVTSLALSVFGLMILLKAVILGDAAYIILGISLTILLTMISVIFASHRLILVDEILWVKMGRMEGKVSVDKLNIKHVGFFVGWIAFSQENSSMILIGTTFTMKNSKELVRRINSMSKGPS